VFTTAQYLPTGEVGDDAKAKAFRPSVTLNRPAHADARVGGVKSDEFPDACLRSNLQVQILVHS